MVVGVAHVGPAFDPSASAAVPLAVVAWEMQGAGPAIHCSMCVWLSKQLKAKSEPRQRDADLHAKDCRAPRASRNERTAVFLLIRMAMMKGGCKGCHGGGKGSLKGDKARRLAL